CFFFIVLPPLIPTLFPYTTLFRSQLEPIVVKIIKDRCSLIDLDEVANTTRLLSKRIKSWRLEAPDNYGDAANYGILNNEGYFPRSEEHTSELQSRENLVCRLLLEK